MSGLHETIYSIFRLLTRDLTIEERVEFAIADETVTCLAHPIVLFSALILKSLSCMLCFMVHRVDHSILDTHVVI
jgi:hypothetical protein